MNLVCSKFLSSGGQRTVVSHWTWEEYSYPSVKYGQVTSVIACLWYLIVKHGTSWIDKKTAKFFFDLHKPKNFGINERKLYLTRTTENHGPLTNFETWFRFQVQTSLNQGKANFLVGSTCDNNFTFNLSFLFFFQKDLIFLSIVTVNLGKGDHQNFGGLFDINSNLTLIPRDLQKHCFLPIKLGLLRSSNQWHLS